MKTNVINENNVADSEEKQRAVLGHAIQDRHFLTRLQVWGLNPSWFNHNPMDGGIYKNLLQFESTHHRHPTVAELFSSVKDDMGLDYVARFKSDIKRAISYAQNIGQDVLIPELRWWAANNLITTSLNEGPIERAFNNEKDVPKTIELLKTFVNDLTRVQEMGESTSRFLPSAERVQGITAKLDRMSQKKMRWGIPFLDDATNGIYPNDLIILGAKSGKGKTELCTTIARALTKQKKRVAFFALEAFEDEIEARLMYSLVTNEYFKDIQQGNIKAGRYVSFASWMGRELQQELGPYEQPAIEKYRANYQTLDTFYKVRGEFTLDHLQAKISQIRNETDVIIIDHLAFIDDGPEKNHFDAQAKITKTLMELVRDYEIPVILVAHLKKLDRGKGSPLLPDQEDFSGSGGIFQVATTTILMSPCQRLIERYDEENGKTTIRPYNPESSLKDTFFAVRKCRTQGPEVTDTTAILQFDTRTKLYLPNYAVGFLTDHDSQWEPAQNKPRWAVNGYTKNIYGTKQSAKKKEAA